MSDMINQSQGGVFDPINLPSALPPEVSQKAEQAAVSQTGGQVFKDTVAASGDFFTGGVGSSVEIPPPTDSKTPPLPSPAFHAEASTAAAGSVLPLDSAAAAWFTGNALAALRSITIDLQRTNRMAVMQLELAVAKFMQITQDLSEAKAKLTVKEYQNQAKQAMMDMIGGAIQLGVTVASTGLSFGVGAVGGVKGFMGAEGSFAKGLAGFGGGVASMSGVTGAMAGTAQGISQVVTNAFKMGYLKEMGEIKRDQIYVDMAQQAMKDVMDAVTKMADNAQSMNDAIRQMMESISKDEVRYFGQLGA